MIDRHIQLKCAIRIGDFKGKVVEKGDIYTVPKGESTAQTSEYIRSGSPVYWDDMLYLDSIGLLKVAVQLTEKDKLPG